MCDFPLIPQLFGTELAFCPELFTLKPQLTLRLLIRLQSALVHSLAELIAVGRLNLCLVFSFRLFHVCLVAAIFGFCVFAL